MEEFLSGVRKGTRDYLSKELVPALIEGLTEAAIKRPDQPLLWLSQFILDRSPVGTAYKIVPVDAASPSSASAAAAEVVKAVAPAPSAPTPAASSSVDGDKAHHEAGPSEGMLVGTKYKVTRVQPLGTAGTETARALVHVLDLETHSTSVVELKQHEEAKPRVVDGHSVSGTLHHLTLAAPGLIAAIEDVGRRLYRAPSSSEHEGGKDGNEGDEAALKLVGEEEGKLRAAVASGSVRGVARGTKISGHPYVVSVSWDGGDVVIGAYDPATAVTLNVHVSPSRQATLGLPASLLRPANPDSPPSPADWEALFHRLSVRRDTAPHTLVLA